MKFVQGNSFAWTSIFEYFDIKPPEFENELQFNKEGLKFISKLVRTNMLMIKPEYQ